MRALLAVLLVVTLMLMAVYVDADPIEITGGTVTAYTFGSGDYWYELSGENFSLAGGTSTGGYAVLDGGFYGTARISFIKDEEGSAGLTVNGIRIPLPNRTEEDFYPVFGWMDVVGKRGLDFWGPRFDSTTFTMTGRLDAGFDIVGHGVVSIDWCVGGSCGDVGVTYTFLPTADVREVPEPAMLGLLIVGVLVHAVSGMPRNKW